MKAAKFIEKIDVRVIGVADLPRDQEEKDSATLQKLGPQFKLEERKEQK